jgi:F-type H+-transporting ATPase subunit b
VLRVQASTIVLQMANFFVLLAVLTWFLYRPLRQVMRRREDEITRRIQDAEERGRRADAEREQLAVDARRAKTDAEAVLDRARTEASEMRRRLLEQTRQEAARSADEARARIEAEERAVRERLEDTVRRTAVSMTGALIQQAVGPAFHRALIEQLLARGVPFDGDQAALVRRALSRANGGVTVEAAYALSPDLTERIRAAIAEPLGIAAPKPEIAVRVEPSLRAGLRILVENVVIDLSLNRILAELESPAR